MPYREEHLQRFFRLKDAERKLKLGPPVHLGVSVEWGQTPRAGARWSSTEQDELIRRFRGLLERPQVQLTAEDIARLAWHFGRSSSSIDTKLGELLRQEYYRRAQF
jgi:hypothetical protein